MFGKGYWPPRREYATLRGARGTEPARHGVQPTQRVLPTAACRCEQNIRLVGGGRGTKATRFD